MMSGKMTLLILKNYSFVLSLKGSPMVQWLGNCHANIKAVGSNPTQSCASEMFCLGCRRSAVLYSTTTFIATNIGRLSVRNHQLVISIWMNGYRLDGSCTRNRNGSHDECRCFCAAVTAAIYSRESDDHQLWEPISDNYLTGSMSLDSSWSRTRRTRSCVH